jgi:ATP-dependent DNA ligase
MREQGVRGIDFEALYSRKHDDQVQLYAFDRLALDGDDLRQLPLSMRKANLGRLLARRPDGTLSLHSSRARSDRIYSVRPVAWGWKVW